MSVAPSKALSPAQQLAEAMKGPAKPSKYRAVRTVVDGITFDSKKEASRWGVLLLRERAGEISDLQRQVRFPLVVNGVDCGAWIADHVYHENGQRVVEDVKSPPTRANPTYRLKRLLVRAIHNIEIREV